jgi:hypothetical protein
MKDPVINEYTLDDVITVEQMAALRPDLFTVEQLREIIKQRKRNGLEKFGAVTPRGRKKHLIKPNFILWFLSGEEVSD